MSETAKRPSAPSPTPPRAEPPHPRGLHPLTKWGLWAVAGLLALGLLSSLLTPSSPPRSTARGPQAPPAVEVQPALELLGWEWARTESDATVLRGQVRNNSDTPFALVFIEFNVYDRPGDQIGTASALVRNLEPQGTWRFEARVFHGDALTAKVKSLRGTR